MRSGGRFLGRAAKMYRAAPLAPLSPYCHATWFCERGPTVVAERGGRNERPSPAWGGRAYFLGAEHTCRLPERPDYRLFTLFYLPQRALLPNILVTS